MTIPNTFKIGEREQVLDFILYEEPSANAPHRKTVPFNDTTHAGLKIGMLVDNTCKPITPYKTAAEVTAASFAGISLCAAGLINGLTTSGEIWAVYLTSSPKARVILKETILDKMAEYHIDSSVTNANIAAAIIAAIKAQLISKDFDIVPMGL